MSPVSDSILSAFLFCRLFPFGAISIYRLAPIRIYPSAVRSTEILQLFQLRTRWAAGAWSLVKKCNRQSCSESLDLSTLPCAEFVDDARIRFFLFYPKKETFWSIFR